MYTLFLSPLSLSFSLCLFLILFISLPSLFFPLFSSFYIFFLSLSLPHSISLYLIALKFHVLTFLFILIQAHLKSLKHCDVKNFSCPVCKMSFNRKWVMEEHILR
jgi:hypothetical protein